MLWCGCFLRLLRHQRTYRRLFQKDRFMSPRLGRSSNRERLAASRNNTLVNAHRDLKLPTDICHDTDIVRLQEILTFLAIMRWCIATARGGQDDPDILNRLHSEPIYCKLFTVEGKLPLDVATSELHRPQAHTIKGQFIDLGNSYVSINWLSTLHLKVNAITYKCGGGSQLIITSL